MKSSIEKKHCYIRVASRADVHIEDICWIEAKKSSFFKRHPGSYKFAHTPFIMLRIDCACRKKPETSFSWSKTRFYVRKTRIWAQITVQYSQIVEINSFCFGNAVRARYTTPIEPYTLILRSQGVLYRNFVLQRLFSAISLQTKQFRTISNTNLGF